jgi:hypothetical protein
MTHTEPPHTVGTRVEGYTIPVVNERAVRAAAGILFIGGALSFAFAFVQDSQVPLQPLGIVFMFDMLLRVTAGDRWSPTLALGRLIVSKQQPSWVGAPQKEFAWWLGFGLALVSCAGCALQRLLTKTPPQYCPGNTCRVSE